ncbi:MAG: glycosyltransferase [Candidatus Dadabacteria bacterium]|nr:MAG: glycosyltransferase [Candidatus Dadabacteria bacterium]
MQKKPLISVVTVSYNHARFLKQNIESVLAQNYPDFEHIIVDGGSNDGTLELLRSYPHLKWTSEPDNGQTDALNKGFRRASGDIIAWLNSDDWYPPGVFDAVSKALQEYPVVIGACQRTDIDGNPTEYLENTECTRFDILKYWVYFSIPAQPSIFFRREVLEEVRLSDGVYLDESLEYTMDYEFWLRVAEKYSFNHRIDRVLSYYRMYDDNKTGDDWAPIYRESSRVFKRHSRSIACAEAKLAYLIPFESVNGDLEATLSDINRQSLKDNSVVLIDISRDQQNLHANKKWAVAAGAEYRCVTFSYVRSDDPRLLSAYNAGINAARAELICFAKPGMKFPDNFSFEAANLFQTDSFGIAMPLKGSQEALNRLTVNEQGARLFRLEALLSEKLSLNGCVARMAALKELAGFRRWQFDVLGIKELFMRLAYKAWRISVDNNLLVDGREVGVAEADDVYNIFQQHITAQLISDIQQEFESEPFAKIRARHGFTITFPEDAVKQAQALIENAPADWFDIEYISDSKSLGKLIENYPKYFPPFYLLARRELERGDNIQAEQLMQRFRELVG